MSVLPKPDPSAFKPDPFAVKRARDLFEENSLPQPNPCVFKKDRFGPARRVEPQPLAGSLEHAFAKFVAARYPPYVGKAILTGYTGVAGGTLKSFQVKIRGGRLYGNAHLK